MPAARIRSTAAAVVAAATPAVRSSRTVTAKPAAGGVQRGRHHAVVGRDAHHLDRVHPGGAQPVGQRDPVRTVPLEARVRRRVLALVEDRLEPRPVQPRVQLLAAGADHAVRRPAVHEVRRRARSARPGRCGGPGWRPRRRSRPRRAGPEIAAATSAPPATASEPPSVKSFCTSTTSAASAHGDPSTSTVGRAGSPRDSFRPSHGTVRSAPAQVVAGPVRASGSPVDPRAAAHQRHLQQPVVPARAPGPAAGDQHLLGGGPGGPVPAHRGLPAAVGGLVLRPLRHRPPVHLDQLVDHARGRRAGPGHHRGADPVRVHRRGGQRRQRPLVQVAGQHDPGAGGAERVELLAGLVGQHGQVAGVDPDRTELRAGHLDRGPDALGDVVRVHQQRGADAERLDLGLERGRLAVVQQREGVRRGAGWSGCRTGGRPRGWRWTAKPARYAARAAATAASSWVRREPISISGRSPAAVTIRAAAEATALSWLRIDNASVSSSTASPNVPVDGQHRRAGEVELALRVAVHVGGEPPVGQRLQQSPRRDRTAPARPARPGRSGSDSSASSSRPVPATTPYRRPSGSRRANSSKTQCRPALPSRSAEASMVSSYRSVSRAVEATSGA